MRRLGRSFWFASLLIASFPLACAVDEEQSHPDAAPPFYVVPAGGFLDRSPTVDGDGDVLAWVRRRYDIWGAYRILRMEGRGEPETLLAHRGPITSIDLSTDGGRLLGLIEGDTARVILWREAGDAGAILLDVPPEYLTISTPRWADTTSFLFGANGPDGHGIYRWDLSTGNIAPLCARFSAHGGLWLGSSPGLDSSGRMACMERMSISSTSGIESIVCLLGSQTPALVLAGQSPSFWRFLPGESDGLLYIDSVPMLHALRPATGEEWIVLPWVVDYDISADGRWLFADSALDLGRALILFDLRSLR